LGLSINPFIEFGFFYKEIFFNKGVTMLNFRPETGLCWIVWHWAVFNYIASRIFTKTNHSCFALLYL